VVFTPFTEDFNIASAEYVMKVRPDSSSLSNHALNSAGIFFAGGKDDAKKNGYAFQATTYNGYGSLEFALRKLDWTASGGNQSTYTVIKSVTGGFIANGGGWDYNKAVYLKLIVNEHNSSTYHDGNNLEFYWGDTGTDWNYLGSLNVALKWGTRGFFGATARQGGGYDTYVNSFQVTNLDKNNVTIFNFDGNTSRQYDVNYAWNTVSPNVTDGNYFIDVNVNDGSSTAQDSSDYSFMVDDTNATCSASGDVQGWAAPPQKVTLTCTDATSGVNMTSYYRYSTSDFNTVSGGTHYIFQTVDGNIQYDFNASDLAGNGSAIGKLWIETVSDTTPPTITSVSPFEGQQGVASTANIVVTFSEAMNASSVQNGIDVNNGVSLIAGTITLNANNNVATFDPSPDLNTGTTYTVRVKTTVTDSASNALAEQKEWNFTTANAYSLSLSAGWNLASLPEVPADTNISKVLASILSDVTSVWSYDSFDSNAVDGWRSFNPANPCSAASAGCLSSMTAGYGYWVNMADANTLSGSGSLFLQGPNTFPSRRLNFGWNLIGHYNSVDQTVRCVLGRIVNNGSDGILRIPWTQLLTYTGSTLTSVGDLVSSKLQDGKGYWFLIPGLTSGLVANAYIYAPVPTSVCPAV